MPNFKNDPVVSVADNTNVPAVQGVSSTLKGIGVEGRSTYQPGVHGVSAASNGILGESSKNDGVAGVTTGDGKAGVSGVCNGGSGNGVYGRSKDANGVIGSSSSDVHAGVAGVNDNSAGVGIYGNGGRLAGLFQGDVEVTGNLRMTSTTGDIQLANGDCAERFTVAGAEEIDPGTVMVLGPEGILRQSGQAYDRRVAGVISGAGDYRPGIVLDSHGAEPDRMPVALVGKVFCKVDAQYGPVEIGDLLTTSPTPGHAMKAVEPMKAFGSVIGKALRPLDAGQGLIPVLVSLQ